MGNAAGFGLTAKGAECGGGLWLDSKRRPCPGTASSGRAEPASWAGSDVEVFDVEGVLFDELAAGGDFVAH